MDEEAFRRRYRDSPVFRIGRARLLRNVAVALGNWGSGQAVPALVRTLTDVEPLVRGHAAWALGAIGGPEVRSALKGALRSEPDPWVQHEMQMAVGASSRRIDTVV
jgi:epoxyqueuosine reductase